MVVVVVPRKPDLTMTNFFFFEPLFSALPHAIR